jgi:hypothetical protein
LLAEAQMEKLILDPQLVAQLLSIKQPAQLCTPDGQVIGSFTPAGVSGQSDGGRPFIAEEELRKRENRKEGRTWAEIKADLEKRG